MIDLEHRTLDGIDVIRLDGRLEAIDSDGVAARLVSLLECGQGTMALEVSDLEIVESSGLSMLVSLLRRARRNEGDVVLYNVNARLQALLELTRLHDIFEMRQSEAYRCAFPSG